MIVPEIGGPPGELGRIDAASNRRPAGGPSCAAAAIPAVRTRAANDESSSPIGHRLPLRAVTSGAGRIRSGPAENVNSAVNYEHDPEHRRARARADDRAVSPRSDDRGRGGRLYGAAQRQGDEAACAAGARGRRAIWQGAHRYCSRRSSSICTRPERCGVTVACEYLADQGLIGGATTPVRLTRARARRRCRSSPSLP